MDYRDYQHSSYKHLSTCLSILDAIKLFHDNTENSARIVKDPDLKSVLHNIFYLSGYTLESIINYSIFKHYRFNGKSVKDIDYTFSEKCGLSYAPNTRKRSGFGTYPFWISQHDFKRNVQLLQKNFRGSGLPFIDPSTKVDKELIAFFTEWNVEIRYHPESYSYSKVKLTKENVTNFVKLTETIYNGLMKLVG